MDTANTEENRPRQLRYPAVGLIFTSIASLAITGVLSLLETLRYLGEYDITDMFESPEAGGRFLFVFTMLLFPLANLATLSGGISMLKLTSLKNARYAALLSCLPICSPFLVLGIPFGIWATILLFSRNYSTQFKN